MAKKFRIDGSLQTTGDLVVQGNLDVKGNLNLEGETTVTNKEFLEVADNIIITNGTASDGTGLVMKTNNPDNPTEAYGLMYNPGNSSVQLGLGAIVQDDKGYGFEYDAGQAQSLATRSNNIQNAHLPVWDNSSYMLVDSGVEADSNTLTAAKYYAKASGENESTKAKLYTNATDNGSALVLGTENTLITDGNFYGTRITNEVFERKNTYSSIVSKNASICLAYVDPEHLESAAGQVGADVDTIATDQPVNDPFDFDITTGGYGNSIVINAAALEISLVKEDTANPLNPKTSTVISASEIQSPAFYATSDARKKENIVDYVPENSILDLPVKEFNFIGQDKKQIGCIAQDLQQLFPNLVQEDNDGYLSIQENKLVYLLLDEVKKLKAEVEILKNNK